VATPYKIHLEAYDGPLDLLLDLIRKQEMDIHNIPIAQITGQYLDYLHKLEQLDVDVSADFIYMAATLILIKSKMLLPPDPLATAEEQIDPRAELVQRLVEHEKFKNAAQLLYERQQLEAHVWSKPERSLYEGEDMEGELVVSLVDLVRVFQQVLERRKEVVRIELHRDEFTVKHMMETLRQQLAMSDEGVELAAFFEDCPTRSAMICALLAVLELVRLQAIVLTQKENFGAIWLRKHKMFDEVFRDGGPIRGGAGLDDDSPTKSMDEPVPEAIDKAIAEPIDEKLP
jgi:segregation and condensation protein A